MIQVTYNLLSSDWGYYRKSVVSCQVFTDGLLSEGKTKMNQDKFEEMVVFTLESVRADISNIKSDISWVKGKLEGRAETRHVILTAISIIVAICAVVVAILK